MRWPRCETALSCYIEPAFLVPMVAGQLLLLSWMLGRSPGSALG